MYTKCFSTLICCGWAYGFALTLLCLCRLGVEFGKIGVGQSLSDVVMSWLRLQTCLECIPHPNHMYRQCFSTLICCGWAYGSALTLLCLCRSGVEFTKIGVLQSLSDVVMSWLRLQTHLEYIPHPLSISYVYKVFQHLDMLWMGIWIRPYTVMPVQVGGGIWKNWGRAEPE